MSESLYIYCKIYISKGKVTQRNIFLLKNVYILDGHTWCYRDRHLMTHPYLNNVIFSTIQNITGEKIDIS